MAIRRINLPEVIERGVPSDGLLWIMDWRSYDLPATIAAGIRNAAPGLVAVTLSMLGGPQMIYAAEQAALERGIRVLWWIGPSIGDLSEEGQAFLRRCARETRAALAHGEASVTEKF